MTFSPLLDFADFCGRLLVSKRTGRRIIRAGKIGVLRIEGSVRIPEAELERFLTERFIPPHEPVRAAGPQEIEGILDRVAPRRRGRPKIGGTT
jgi:excisionase family DNA binding protein